jgi:hypothetical protein
LRQVRRAYRPKTPEGAANSTYVHFLFGLIFKYEATTEQGRKPKVPLLVRTGWHWILLNNTGRANYTGKFSKCLRSRRAGHYH